MGLAVERGERAEAQWDARLSAYGAAFPALAQELAQRLRGELPGDWDAALPRFAADGKGLATREASGQVMNAIAVRLPALVGGSADLRPVDQDGTEGPG